jgi:PAS domain S-box-containing protein
MPEQLLSWRTTYSWLSCLSSMTLARASDGGVSGLTTQCPLPVAVLDLVQRKIAVMSPQMSALLGVAADEVGTIDLAVMSGGWQRLDALFDLLITGAIDTYGVRQALDRGDHPHLEADSWVAVSSAVDRHLALWILAPVGDDAGKYLPEPTEATWQANSSGLVVGSFSPEWRLERLSVDAETLLGYRVDELVGHPLIDWVHPDDLPELFATLARCLVDRAGVGVRLQVRHRSGEWLDAQAIVTRLAEEARLGVSNSRVCQMVAAAVRSLRRLLIPAETEALPADSAA